MGGRRKGEREGIYEGNAREGCCVSTRCVCEECGRGGIISCVTLVKRGRRAQAPSHSEASHPSAGEMWRGDAWGWCVRPLPSLQTDRQTDR